MTTTQSRLYPGMVNTDVEFFKTEDGLKLMSSGKILKFKELPVYLFKILKDKLHSEPKALKILQKWYPNDEMLQLEKFTECRFGGLDFTPDIKDNVLQEGEYHDCPIRHKCKGDGIICQSLRYNGHVLSQQDIKLLRLIATSHINEVIAEMLGISLGMFHKVKKALYSKLNVQTKQEATLIAVDLNLIQRIYADA